MKKYYVDQVIVDYLIPQGGIFQSDKGGFYVMGILQGVGSIDLFNSRNNSTYLCWVQDGKDVGVKVYNDQVREG